MSGLGSNHSFCFSLDDCLLLRSRGSCSECSIESSNFSHSGSHVAGLGNALLLSLNDCLLLLFNNYLLLCRGLSCEEFCIERIHFCFKCEHFSRFTCGLNGLGSNHSLSFGLDDCLLLGKSRSSVESSGKRGNFCHSRSHVTGIGNALLLSSNNSLLLLFDNYLLLSRSLSAEEFCIESIHFSFESKLFLGFSCGLNICRFNHSFLFCNDDSLFFFGGLSSSECSIESSNFSHKSLGACIIARNTLLFSLYNGIFLFFDDRLLLCRCFCSCISGIEFLHVGLEFSLFCSFCSLCLSRLCHSSLFGSDDSLLFFGGLSGCESGIECSDLCHQSLVVSVTARKSLLFSFYDCLLLFFGNSLLLLWSLCSSISVIQFLHFRLELRLLFGLYSLSLSRLGHCLLLGNDNGLLFFGSSCSSKGSIECGDFSSGCIKFSGACNTLLLGLDNGLLLLFDNSLLLFGRLSSGQFSVKSVHFGFELSLFSCLCNCLFGCGTNHSLLFGTNQSIFCLRSLSGIVSGIEGIDFSIGRIGADSLCTALLLGFDNSLLFSLDNSLLLFFGLCVLVFVAQNVHFRLQLSLFCGKSRSLLACLEHRFLFCLNNSMLLLGSFS